MKIVVLGSGAMGSMYGSILSQRNEVWLYDIWQDHIDEINKNGLKIKFPDNSEKIFHPHATTNAESIGMADLVIIFVKSIDTPTVLAQNKFLFKDSTMVLTLQNGYGNDEDILPYVQENNLLLGTTSGGATLLGPGHVFQVGLDLTTIGVRPGCSLEMAEKVVEEFNACGINSVTSNSAMEMVWKKLMVNIGCCAVLSLLEKNNGFLDYSSHAYDVALAAVREACAVAKADGYTFDADAICHHFFHVNAPVMGRNLCSMLQDTNRKRKTEIEKFNGAVVKLGKKYGVPTPYNEVLVKLVQAKEDGYHYENK